MRYNWPKLATCSLAQKLDTLAFFSFVGVFLNPCYAEYIDAMPTSNFHCLIQIVDINSHTK